jgi:hypothetical protein
MSRSIRTTDEILKQLNDKVIQRMKRELRKLKIAQAIACLENKPYLTRLEQIRIYNLKEFIRCLSS